jgi:hypothetical protein
MAVQILARNTQPQPTHNQTTKHQQKTQPTNQQTPNPPTPTQKTNTTN